MSNVLITGGTGLVGTALSALLAEQGHLVKHLSRTRNLSAVFPAYEWNLNEGTADDEAFNEIDYIFHLADVSGNKKWAYLVFRSNFIVKNSISAL